MMTGLILFLLLGDAARLTFSKSFPGSSPDYYRITLGEDGRAVYATAPEDDKAVPFQVSGEITRRAFELAGQLNHFRGPSLETRKRIAAMGKKTVTWENGAERGEQVFNYSENLDAQALTELFEKLSNTHQHRLALVHLARYDKLGLMKQLLLLESAVNKKDLAEPQLLVPTLEEIAGNKAYLGIAQQRAKIILAKIQAPKP